MNKKRRGQRLSPQHEAERARRRASKPDRVSADRAAQYIAKYILAYRRAYERFTAVSPDGPGYPQLAISPYIIGVVDCLIALDGAIVLTTDASLECFSDPRMRRSYYPTAPGDASTFQFVGPADADVSVGRLPPTVAVARAADESNQIDVRSAVFSCSIGEILTCLTYGGMSRETNPANTYFWMPMMIHNMVVARGSQRRYLEYMEVLDHVDISAWDVRSTLIRAHSDVNRDFVAFVGHQAAGPGGGTISLQGEPEIRQAFGDVLRRFSEAIGGFERLLEDLPEGVEGVFHEYLERHPVILDLYAATATSKPRFEYPEPQADTNKAYVEPDFVLGLPDQRYRLIELERSRTPLLKRSGEGRAETSHAAFQVGEWRDFIERYPETLRDQFPNMVASSVETLLVLGRDVEGADAPTAFRAAMMKVRNQYRADDIVTYDGLVRRARQALTSLQALNVGSGASAASDS